MKWTYMWRWCPMILFLNSSTDLHKIWARGSVVGWGTMLQAGRSRDRIPIRSLNFFFNLPNPSSRTMALGSTQPLIKMSTRDILGMFLGVKGGQRVRLTTLLPAVSRLSRKCGNLNISQTSGSPQPVNKDSFTLLYFLYWKERITWKMW
jgi:hypothetical protein